MAERRFWSTMLAGWAISVSVMSAQAAEEKNFGFKLPDGFEATLFAGDDLAHDIFSMTLDAQGRVVVSGPGYVKILPDNGKGKCDHAILFSEKPASGAMGMYFDGPVLYSSGDKGIWRLRDSKGQDKADPPEVVVRNLANSEHGAHAIIKGPDGWFYCVCGNDAGVSKEHITTKTSPVKEPKCGAILRFTPDGKQTEVFAHGFRNPYCIDFNATGNLFTVDSDNERDHYLPWYAPTRLFDVGQGREHGWLFKGTQQSWNRPASFYDTVERMCEIGRGSPTGLVCYQHVAFPEHYRGGVFSACWTLGKIYYFPLKRKDRTFETKLETFLDSTGSSGFDPTALAVGPAGEMYVSVGGRGTRGSVYKIRYTKSEPYIEPEGKLARVLLAPQPMTSWSRAKWVPDAKELQAKDAKCFETVFLDAKRPVMERVRAAHIITELFGNLPPTVPEQKIASPDDDDFVLSSSLKNLPGFSMKWSYAPHEDDEILDLFAKKAQYQEPRFLVRSMQLILGDVQLPAGHAEVHTGYQAAALNRKPEPLRRKMTDVLSAAFPTNDAELNREIARTLGMLGSSSSELNMKILAQINEKSTPQDDIHYLIVWSLIQGERTPQISQATADALANLHRKMMAREWLPSRNWPLRVGELFEELYKKDPKLPEALGTSPGFGLPEHSLLVLKLKDKERESLARKLLSKVKESKSELEWTQQFVQCLKSLPRDEYIADLRARWNEPALRDAIVGVLAEKPEAADRERFIQALPSVQAKFVELAANALTQLPDENRPEDITAALRALRQSCQAPQDITTRQTLCKLLKYWTGKKIVINEKDKTNPLPAYHDWFDWFADAYPEASKKLNASTTYDQTAWMARLSKLDFEKGDTVRGKTVFDKRSCSKCHQGSGRLGPELAGAATRFTRDDLFIAILDPSKDVAPLYRTKIVTTTNGETFTGLIVYESPEGLLLQTGPETTVRIANVPEGSIRTSSVSLMPNGLLNEATDEELVDLYAYLRSLKK